MRASTIAALVVLLCACDARTDGDCTEDSWGPAASCAAVPESERKFDAEESRDILEGRHEVSLAWAPLEPFESVDPTAAPTAVFEVSTNGSCNKDFECGYPSTGVNLTLELPDQRRLKFDGTAHLRNGRAEVFARSERHAADALSDPNAAIRGTGGERRYELSAMFWRDGVTGTLNVLDTPRCTTARIPAEPASCERDDREVDWTTRVGGFSLDDALAEAQNVDTVTLLDEHGAGSTELELTVSKGDAAPCSGPDYTYGPTGVRLTGAVLVHARTADGTLDFDLPAELTALVDPSKGLVAQHGFPSLGIPDTRVTVASYALARTDRLNAVDGGELARLRDLSPYASIELNVTTTSAGSSGDLWVRPAERAAGWPELTVPDDARTLSRFDARCSGFELRSRTFGGGWGGRERL